MIPLRDKSPTRSVAVINYFLIAANIVAFLFEKSLGPFANDFILRFGVVPSAWFNETGGLHFSVSTVVPLFTAMFLHGGWMHLLGNMLFLFIFGDNVEDRFGHTRYLLFYFIAGVAASFTQIYFNRMSIAPMIGASGAIAGVLGAYLIMFPKAKILTIVPIFIFIKFMELPAYLFLGIWFLIQIVSGVLSLGIGGDAGGVAWWAHIGGFACGIIAVPIFGRRK
ncbi:MAG TPA: rhomboid family intramembrane serine protease [Bacteroidota bacterium]|nr:rhomboid family intramembrane serine protease [Bacteroidota bacterium]